MAADDAVIISNASKRPGCGRVRRCRASARTGDLDKAQELAAEVDRRPKARL